MKPLAPTSTGASTWLGGGLPSRARPTPAAVSPIDPALSDGAVFDPATSTWKQVASAPVPVGGVLQMTVLGARLYLLTGETDRDDSPVSFMSYDPQADRWATLPRPPGQDPELVAAGSNLVAIASTDEHGPARDYVFDADQSRWDLLPDDPLGPSFGRGAVWVGDRMLLTAADLVDNPGADGPVLTRLALLDPTFSRWTVLPDSDIIGGSPVWTAARVVFPMTGSADGGKVGNWGRDYAEGAIFDPATGTWMPLPTPRSGHSGLEGIVGTIGDRALVGGQLLQPQTGEWTDVPSAPWGREYRSAQTVVTGPDGVFVWGGADGKKNLADGYRLAI